MATPGGTTQSREAELEQKLSDIGVQEQSLATKNLASQLGLPLVELSEISIDPDALRQVPEAQAQAAQTTLIQLSGGSGVIATLDPRTPAAKAIIDDLGTRYQVRVVLVAPSTMATILGRYKTIKTIETFEVGSIRLDPATLAAAQTHIKNITDLQQELGQASVTHIFEVIIAGALAIQASDIHLEPEADKLRVRYRLDGLLQDVATLDHTTHRRITDRLKVLTKMKLNVTKAPQDGRFTIHQDPVDIEVRASVLPGEYGESVVLRLLDPRTIRTKLDELGMNPTVLALVHELMAQPQGMLLTTGPTGSGKTTTLYALVGELNTSDTKIITIEDPIEYHIVGLNQTQVEPDKGYTFASGLRSIVRQDPDIILVGEIRDLETAEIGLNAALTGHLVLSTIHTNDAAGTIPRLIELGVRPESIGPALTMAMGQRLLRRLCPECKKKEGEAYVAVGCSACNNTGYRGRVGVYEAFKMTPDMERLIISRPTVSDIRAQAIKDGMVPMMQDAQEKLRAGITSTEEIKRVLGG